MQSTHYPDLHIQARQKKQPTAEEITKTKDRGCLLLNIDTGALSDGPAAVTNSTNHRLVNAAEQFVIAEAMLGNVARSAARIV